MTANPGEHTLPEIERRGRVPADTLSNRLLLARRLDGVSIEEAVEKVYVSTGVRLTKSSWANWEAGRRPHGETDVISAIAYALDVDWHWLVNGGPLAGPRGPVVRPVRVREDTDRYPGSDVRPTPTRPRSGRPINRRDRCVSHTLRPVVIERPTTQRDDPVTATPLLFGSE